ncbi:WD40-repeat-containing domain protein [Fimicolochytrium jonesii]|uniref:WD40-repeat-containing domain protein n=1 Tax=Fimicolochytrium jonesii TaxID=1396493 RepID=UPI0022FEF674|nr:WD40-repeat-containing domain protein [Fimicolochytrium jonesii]KAI8815841.1 WD40-repeat-containing domain protein [Fimicolochytrium jonesii]
MFCALSGESPVEPVVSQKSGNIYEKRLILKYISENGRDPVSGEELTADDLLTIKLSTKFVKPRPPAATSIPNLLISLQNEWDAVMLETYQLKQQYHAARQELSNALYENDAAKRVISRLVRERDEARAALASVQTTYAAPPATVANGGDQMDVDEPSNDGAALLEQAHQKLQATSDSLSTVRKKRKPAAMCAKPDDVKGYAQIGEGIKIKGATKGVSATDVFSGKVAGVDRELVIVGDKAGHVNILDRAQDNKLTTSHVAAHKSAINDVVFAGKDDSLHFLTAGADKTIKYFQVEITGDDDYSVGAAKWVNKTHTAAVTALSLHPSGDYFISAGADATWAFNDIHTGQTLSSVSQSGKIGGFVSAQIHPDGLILATGGSDSIVRLWDIRSQTNVRDFEAHTGKVTGISFSENGYYLATSSDTESVVQLWDLRKLVNFKSLQIEDAKTTGVSKVRFDYSGQFLAAACGDELRIYLAKKWDQLANLATHGSSHLTDIKFGPDAKYIVSTSADGKVFVDGLSA